MFGPPPGFRERAYVVAAGEAVFFLRNTSPDLIHATHALAIGPEVDQVVALSNDVRAGRSAIFIVQGLQPGTYVIWCPYRDHAELGQLGSLTVRKHSRKEPIHASIAYRHRTTVHTRRPATAAEQVR